MMNNAFTLKVRRDRITKTRKVKSTGGYVYRTTQRAETRHWDEEVRCSITVDMDALCRVLGARAAYAKSGKSTTLGGIIKCKVLNRVESNVELREHPLGSGYELVAEEAP